MNLQKIILFIFNNNIDVVKEIYKNKIPEYMVSHLLDKASYYIESRNDNTLAWVDFIGNLDCKNVKILENYILNK